MDKEKGNKIVRILQIIAAIGLIVVIILLIKALTSKKVETSNLFTKLEMHELEPNGSFETKINDLKLNIVNDGSTTTINGKKLDFIAMKLYTTDKLFILSYELCSGDVLHFYDLKLNELPFDKNNMHFNNIELVDGKIIATGYDPTLYGCGIYTINNLTIEECIDGNTKYIKESKNVIEEAKDKIISLKVSITYKDSLEVTTNDIMTVWDILGKDIIDNTNKYCVINEEE